MWRRSGTGPARSGLAPKMRPHRSSVQFQTIQAASVRNRSPSIAKPGDPNQTLPSRLLNSHLKPPAGDEHFLRAFVIAFQLDAQALLACVFAQEEPTIRALPGDRKLQQLTAVGTMVENGVDKTATLHCGPPSVTSLCP